MSNPNADNGESISYAEQLLMELQRRQDELAEEEGQEDVIQYLTFQLGQESFALPLDSVKSVERLREVTIVPGTHSAILGVINLKSAIVPVIDIHTLLNLDIQPPSRTARFVILSHADTAFGLLVDSVAEVAQISQIDIDTALLMSRDTGGYIQHEINLPDRLLGILNLDAVLQTLREG